MWAGHSLILDTGHPVVTDFPRMSEQTANAEKEQNLDALYEEATARALHDEAAEQRKRNRQDYSIYVDDTQDL